MKIKYFLFLLTFVVRLHAQKEDYQWILGGGGSSNMYPAFQSAVMDFNSIPISLQHFPSQIKFISSSSICDENGQLICFTNWKSLYNNQFQKIENGEDLFPGLYESGNPLAQTTLILPWPGAPGTFCLFWGHRLVYQYQGFNSIGCSPTTFSKIDMTANNGAGKVVLKQEPIIQDTLFFGLYTATRHANGRDWWIIVAHNTRDEFYKFLLDPTGVHFHDKQNFPGYNGAIGQTAFSPNGNNYGLCVWEGVLGQGDHDRLDLYHFDRCTGQLSNRLSKNFNSPGTPGGVAFSPNNQLLYLTKWDKVYQYNLEAPDILASEVLIATYDGFKDSLGDPTRFYTMLLAPDNKIYASIPNANAPYLHIIEEPDQVGTACNFVQHGIQLPVFNNYYVPNIPYPRLYAEQGSPCDTLTLSIHDSAIFPNISVQLFPNPTVDETTLYLPAGGLPLPGLLDFFDPTGKLLSNNVIPSGQDKTLLNLDELPRGMLYYRLSIGNKVVGRGKIVLVR